MTVSLPKFFHQCEVPNTSGLISPALCRIGSEQLLAYSTISPCWTKISAGRSSWLCHGTMPPGSIVSLRKRSSRSLRFAGCFSRLIEPRVTSVTPTGLKSTFSRALALILSAGHSPANAVDVAAVDPAMTQASARPCQSAREFIVCLNMSWSPLFCRGLEMIWPAMRATIAETTNLRKCRLAFESIAQRYAMGLRASQHVPDVGGKRRVGADGVLDLGSGDAKAHRQPEDIDKFLAGMSDEKGAENSVGGLIDDDFRPGHGLRVGSGGKPVVDVVAVNLDREPILVCGGLGQADRSQRRHGIDRGCDTFVVRAVFRPLHDVAADDIALVGRDRRELRRNRHRVAADMDLRVGGRAQMEVHRHAAVAAINISSHQIERVDVGHAPGAIDDAIGLGRMLGAFMCEDHPQPVIRRLDPFHADARLDPNDDAFALGLDARDGIDVHGG